MKIERTKNASRNVIFGVLYKVYSMILPFVIRTVLIYFLGVEYLGLNSLFTSVLQVLNLAELGVGSAMVFSMYKPIAEDDNEKICALMYLYRKYYRIIGTIVLTVGVLIIPFIPNLIKGDIPEDMNVYVLYIFNLSATVLTYWLFAYRNSLFHAFQRIDVINKVALITDTIKYGLQITLVILFHNYYFFVIVILAVQILNNIITAMLSKKMYPQFSPSGEISEQERKKITQRIKDLMTGKIGWTIVSSVDTIVISAFLGLTKLAIYQNYYYIINAFQGIVFIIFHSVTAGSGNSMITETIEKNYYDFKKISFLTFWVIGFFSCGLVCAMQDLMKIWVGSKLMLPYRFVIMFCLYFLGNMYVQLIGVYKDAAGIWHKDRFRPLVSGISNLILNLIMVNFIGLDGIVLSTIISVFCISIPWITKNVFTLIFKNKLSDYMKNILTWIAIILVGIVITSFICGFLPTGGIMFFILKVAVCTVVFNAIMLVAFIKNPLFVELKNIIFNLFVRKIKRR